MRHCTTKDVLTGAVAPGDEITLKGWVRTRRDSKAGLSFIHLTDGSTFAPVQVVAKNDLPNYDSDILRLTSGASLIARGSVAESLGKGQSLELHATEIEVVGLGG